MQVCYNDNVNYCRFMHITNKYGQKGCLFQTSFFYTYFHVIRKEELTDAAKLGAGASRVFIHIKTEKGEFIPTRLQRFKSPAFYQNMTKHAAFLLTDISISL